MGRLEHSKERTFGPYIHFQANKEDDASTGLSLIVSATVLLNKLKKV